jgi:hypothetical protein
MASMTRSQQSHSPLLHVDQNATTCDHPTLRRLAASGFWTGLTVLTVLTVLTADAMDDVDGLPRPR